MAFNANNNNESQNNNNYGYRANNSYTHQSDDRTYSNYPQAREVRNYTRTSQAFEGGFVNGDVDAPMSHGTMPWPHGEYLMQSSNHGRLDAVELVQPGYYPPFPSNNGPFTQRPKTTESRHVNYRHATRALTASPFRLQRGARGII